MPAPAAVADRYRNGLNLSRAALLASLTVWWDQLDAGELDATFASTAGDAVALVAAAQRRAATGAPGYVAGYLEALNVRADPVRLRPAAFAGRCSDGRPLTGPLYSGVIDVKRRVALGQPLEQARAAGLARVSRAVVTEVTDAGREASQAAMLAERRVKSYVREVRLPACGRCLLLAGKAYSVDAGFDRHPRCDCVPAPHLRGPGDGTVEGTGVELFERMSVAEQDAALGQRDAELVRSGEGSLSAVVNARLKRGGVYTPRPAPKAYRTGRKPTPLDIRTEAGGDRDRYLELMREAGYLL